MRTLENFAFQNKELIVRELINDAEDPFEKVNDDLDLTKLVECEIVKVGKEVTNYKEGDFIVIQRDSLKKKRHPALEGVLVVFNDSLVFSKLDE